MPQDPRLTALIAYRVAGARLGRRADAEALVALCHGRLIQHARHVLGDADSARDVVQEAWVDVLRALGSVRDDRAFMGFALRIVSRKAAAEIARRQKKRRIVTDAGGTATGGAEAGGAVPEAASEPETPEAALDLRRAIAALPPNDRAALALFYTQGLSVQEIAQALKIPPGTVKTRLMAARHRLRAILTQAD